VPALQSGDHIGGFRILRKIRAGGASTVFLAMGGRDNREVALKVMHPELAAERGRRREFDNEARVTRQLNHPNIIRLLRYVRTATPPYFIMEFFPGRNLKVETVRNRPFVLENLKKILLQAADAMAYMHNENIIHVDMKPENLLVDDEARIKMIDFALARSVKVSFLPRLGKSAVRGTRHYMSPEQIRGHPLDPRSDIYSLGATIYDVCVGRPPFTGIDVDEILHKHLHEKPIPMREAGGRVPYRLDRLVLQMLAKEADERPQSMMVVRRALERI
jgi:serine/threonine protein kinase